MIRIRSVFTYFHLPRLAQSGERWSAERDVAGSIPGLDPGEDFKSAFSAN